jgi:hypothetical protein
MHAVEHLSAAVLPAGRDLPRRSDARFFKDAGTPLRAWPGAWLIRALPN